MLGYERNFVGRERDFQMLTTWLSDPDTKVVCIRGERGIGKTALASRLFERFDGSRFERKERHIAFGDGAEDWLVYELAKKLLPAVPPNATRDELVDELVSSARETCTLLLLDNAESLQREWLKQFVAKWIDGAGCSVLVLTTTQAPGITPRGGYVVHKLGGFGPDETKAILAILGKEMAPLGRQKLLEASNTVGNSPQRLLYLRWLNPKSADELTRISLRLGTKSEPIDLSLPAIQARIQGPITHFLALGRVRQIEFEEALFAWLWRSLGGGSAETYIRVRDQLVAERLLARVRTRETEVLRINPSVHIQLDKLLNKNVGQSHLPHVDFFLSEYYWQQYERQGDPPATALLGQYAYHATESGNLRGAVQRVLAPQLLRQWHNSGLAIGLRPLLALLDASIERKMRKSSKTDPEMSRWKAEVKIELAHCENDLSEHRSCLQLLDDAENVLGKISEKIPLELSQRTNYLRGISLSDLGQSEDCIRAYYTVVKSGADQGALDERLVLALGYMAFELRFRDSARAELLGNRALELAQRCGSHHLVAKNKCSLAQTLFFSGKLEEAAAHLADAEQSCRVEAPGKSDRRELGRILIHKSMIPIRAGRFDEAFRILDEAEDINKDSGDRRRLATALAIRGIAQFRKGSPNEGIRLMNEAIALHYGLRDWRNLVMEALSCAYMMGYHNQTAACKAACRHTDEPWGRVLCDQAASRPLEAFGPYWASSFRPQLLE